MDPRKTCETTLLHEEQKLIKLTLSGEQLHGSFCSCSCGHVRLLRTLRVEFWDAELTVMPEGEKTKQYLLLACVGAESLPSQMKIQNLKHVHKSKWRCIFPCLLRNALLNSSIEQCYVTMLQRSMNWQRQQFTQDSATFDLNAAGVT